MKKTLAFLGLMMLMLTVPLRVAAFFQSQVQTSESLMAVPQPAGVANVLLSVNKGIEKSVSEMIVNGDFADGLKRWETIGDVSLVNGVEHNVTPFSPSHKMVRIGRDTDAGGKSVDTNIFSQAVGSGVSSIGFWYNFQTYENLDGFDQPGFMVFVNNQMVHQQWASEIPGAGVDGLRSTGWQFVSIDLSQFYQPTVSLAFYAGNTGDLQNQSFVYIGAVTSNDAIVNDKAVFTLRPIDVKDLKSLNYAYKVGGQMVQGSDPVQVQFSLDAQPDNNDLEYWSVNTAGQESLHQHVHVTFDNTPPPTIRDLQLSDDTNGDFSLNWTSGGDAQSYDIRYSNSPIDPTANGVSWLPMVTIKNIDGLPGGGSRPSVPKGQLENYLVHTDSGVNQYWFAVRAVDAAGNLSQAAVVSSGAITPATSPNLPGDVAINEIMWMGSSVSSTDQWLELRNMTDHEIDLTHWSIKMQDATLINFANQTTLPAAGFLVVGRDSAHPNFMLPDQSTQNTQLQLFDPTSLLIDETPIGHWPAGEDSTNKRSMERNNIPGDGSDPSGWHTCDSQSCADAQSKYWTTTTDFGTPGGPNLSFAEDQIQPTLTTLPITENNFQFHLDGLNQFTQFSYTLEYDHQVDNQTVHEAIQGQQQLLPKTRDIDSAKIYLGTCSDTCTPHTQITNVKLHVTLQNQKGLVIVLESRHNG